MNRLKTQRLRFPFLVTVAVAVIVIGCQGEPGSTTTAEPPASAATEPGPTARIPDEFPQPPEVEDFDELILSSEDIQVQWETGMSTQDVVEFYDQALPDRGWEVLSRREGGDSTRYRVQGHGWDGAVTVLDGQPVKIVLQLGSQDDG